MIRSDFVDSVI